MRRRRPLLREIEALRVGPDEVLILKLPEAWPVEYADALAGAVAEAGLEGRALVIRLDVMEAIVVPRDQAPAV